MICFAEAKRIYEQQFPENKIVGAIETQDEWVFSAVDKGTGLELDMAPIAISKNDGNISAFFPPANRAKLKSAIQVDLND